MALSNVGKIIEQMVTDAKALSITGLPDNHIRPVGGINATTFKDQIPNLPAVVVAPFGPEVMDPTAGTNASDDYAYPVIVAIVDAANQDHDFETMDLRHKWREQLLDEWYFQQISVSLTNANVYLQTVDPFPQIDQSAWEKNWWLSAFVVNFWIRKTRA